MRKKLLICNNAPGIGMMVSRYFNATDFTVWNCTMYPYDLRKHLDKRVYDAVVFFAGSNKDDVIFTIRNLKLLHPKTEVIVVMLYKWEHFEENYYDEGATLCLWLQETSASLLSSFIRLTLFQREHPDVDMCISAFLASLGFTGFHKGFYYLCAAMSMCLDEPERLNSVIKDVYGETANRCNAANYRNVERILRYYLDMMLHTPELDKRLKIKLPKRPPLKQCISGLCTFYKECNYYNS